ncbi:HAD family hydrolase [Roseiterribacter gracilis]|uniref:phosphoglycolate phosphatase n=1 Tax=Roseiterribacter gracilis TaxID=2812848 RepID=A0A8S8XB53_9PROT|nr:haloacid dehalogenase [Rhodospirillales bacterium TMPK1]
MSEALPAPRAILFDWDNTLVDNWRCVQAALNTARSSFDLPPLDLAETLANARLSARDSFPRMFGTQWEQARAIFYEAFERLHLEGLVALAGAERLLDWTRNNGVPAAVVSNKRGAFLRREVTHLGWDDRFGVLVGAGDAPRDKPDAAPAVMALAALGVEASPGVWFVGDTDVDLRTGLAAGCTPVLVETSDLDPALMLDCPPAARVRNLDGLLGLVEAASRPISGTSSKRG